MKATAKDLRFHAKELIDSVGRGEEVVITLRGKPCAKLVPYPEAQDKPGQNGKNALFGMWKDNEAVADVAGHVRALRQGRF